ncbi:dTMP kinase [Vaginisenegalia massiliensis]|uniref:dTMP kinase n=1 Tax=Vaginisenegalia massiliensis TaxID=2058294 RepID=UPI000F520BF3|nr:dTMP kinase [Vaginisenegalia massiliensis]
MKKGRFISIEGPDGSGKSSTIKALSQLLDQAGWQDQYILTREPGGSAIAEQIRQILLDVHNQDMDHRTEALLFAASRRQHLVETVIPALEAGKIVICDRFVDSSLAYQGIARNISTDLIWQINHFAIEDYLPDLTLLIDVPAEVGLERIYKAQGKRQFDRLDRESVDFHNLVRQAFLDFAAEQERIVLVDGTKPVDQVAQDCLELLQAHGII